MDKRTSVHAVEFTILCVGVIATIAVGCVFGLLRVFSEGTISVSIKAEGHSTVELALIPLLTLAWARFVSRHLIRYLQTSTYFLIQGKDWDED